MNKKLLLSNTLELSKRTKVEIVSDPNNINFSPSISLMKNNSLLLFNVTQWMRISCLRPCIDIYFDLLNSKQNGEMNIEHFLDKIDEIEVKISSNTKKTRLIITQTDNSVQLSKKECKKLYRVHSMINLFYDIHKNQ